MTYKIQAYRPLLDGSERDVTAAHDVIWLESLTLKTRPGAADLIDYLKRNQSSDVKYRIIEETDETLAAQLRKTYAHQIDLYHGCHLKATGIRRLGNRIDFYFSDNSSITFDLQVNLRNDEDGE